MRCLFYLERIFLLIKSSKWDIFSQEKTVNTKTYFAQTRKIFFPERAKRDRVRERERERG